MAGWSTIRPAFLTVLQGISGIGATFSYPRWNAETMQQSAYKDSNGRLHFWWFQRTSVNPDITRTGGSFSYIHTVKLEGFMIVKDNTDASLTSETTFQELIDTVIDTFNSKDNTYFVSGDGSIKFDNPESIPAELILAEIGNFNNQFLSHHCEIEVRVREDKTP